MSNCRSKQIALNFMDKSIAAIRKDYTIASLALEDIKQDPINQFKKWFDEALDAKVNEPNAMNLATAAEGVVSSRIVLIKEIDVDGFVFYSNYTSDKAKAIGSNNHVALNFFWPELERQVRIQGLAQKISAERSDAYFNSRPRASQIGAWVSPQSNVIEDRNFLDKRQQDFETQFEGKDVPRPEHWGGYKIIPDLLEFWQGRSSRLHDRIKYNKTDSTTWQIERLAP